MKLPISCRLKVATIATGALVMLSMDASAADKELLDILLGNKAINQAQYDYLITRESLSAGDLSGQQQDPQSDRAGTDEVTPSAEELDARIAQSVDRAVAKKVDKDFPVEASHGSKGFKLATRDGKWETNLQWRAQMRYSGPYLSDPRQIDDFEAEETADFQARRLRMKIGGHGFQPWLGYYFEVDLQPGRDFDEGSANTSARVIDWRITADKWDWLSFRVGQWKIDHNRERVDSSGRQQFVERSIVNRAFTIDRQIGVQLRGHLFQDTPADMRYYLGAYTGEGRGVQNNDDELMWAGRLQWNFLGRDLAWKQTDVEFTEQPTGSLAFAAMTNEGSCTRWSSSGCGNLDGFARPAATAPGQFKIDQYLQELAFKWRGFSFQQEYHWKEVEDRAAGSKHDLEGAYAQAGYFPHRLFPSVPKPLEIAFRYAFVDEPNEVDRQLENTREEFTLGANWFFAGHNNKLTMDFSHLKLEDEYFRRDISDNRFRFQWDVSF